jgi:hypothetical protein
VCAPPTCAAAAAYLKPSEKRVDALWNTHALSTPRKKASAAAASSVTMVSAVVVAAVAHTKLRNSLICVRAILQHMCCHHVSNRSQLYTHLSPRPNSAQGICTLEMNLTRTTARTCVPAAVGVYVVDGCCHVRHHLKGHVHAAVLMVYRGGRRQAAPRLRLLQPLTSMHLHSI